MKRTALLPLTTAFLALVWHAGPAVADEPATAPPTAAEYREMLEEAERARGEAEAARREAEKLAERAHEMARLQAERARQQAESAAATAEQRAREHAVRAEERERVREELSRAHRELREASREIARAHRELARAEQERVLPGMNLGDRAVIGVVLGPTGENGIELIGVSPDGPAEKAGLQAGDVMTGIAGEKLAGESGARERLFEIMENVEAGDRLEIIVDRDGEPKTFTVEAEVREPSSWQSIIRIPEVSAVELPEGVIDAEIVMEHIRVPEIDKEALRDRMAELQERLETRKFIFVDPDGSRHEWDGDMEFEFETYSDFADRAFADADVWFGPPHTRGLEFATLNAALGKYFKAERGVLVLRAEADNAYGLRAGDVILEVDGETVDTPAELMRVLRRAEPGEAIVFGIKRERRAKTLEVTMPESRLGLR